MSTTSTIKLKVEFSGGLELLFSNQRSHRIEIPAVVPSDNSTIIDATSKAGDKTKSADVTYLMYHLRDHLLKERVELFMEAGTVRPGILVLINDTDWELEGEGEYVLKDGDEIVFISTLHGG
ncbi:ubiquitin-related modifier 1 [Athelia psychrophila]|uniref:Ubiquitin-related modifier 1 n=1 Tax=Athelia psychrophila TaxID=1759441 RepID=A0A166TMW3_9AGAM|nr:ubiquitin-related modifier 1 [Fibularhizoctonia sp. CBS 109695]